MAKSYSFRSKVAKTSQTLTAALGKSQLECDVCGRILSSAYKLREHVMIHTGQKPHACDKCSQAFRTKPDLARHMRIHTGVRPYACKLCGQRFYRSDNLKGHMKTHKDMEVLSCFRCGQVFPTLEQLNVHYKKKHDKEDKAENQAYLDALNKSEEMKETKDSTKSTRTSSKQENQAKDDKKEKEKVVEHSLALQRERRSTRKSQGTPGNDSPESDTKQKGAKQPQTQQNEASGKKKSPTFWCSECSQGFHQRGALALHVKAVHTGQSQPVGEVQEKDKTQVESIPSDTAFICPTCGKVFSELGRLKDHIENNHMANDVTEELKADENMNTFRLKDIQNDCNKIDENDAEIITLEDSCDNQMEMIESDKAEPVPVLSKPLHMMLNHINASDVGVYDVPHQRNPDEPEDGFVTCDTCRKVYPTKQDLYRHEVSAHSHEMPFRCTSCGRGFARKDRLANHMRMHTGKSPHSCEFCSKIFTAASSLKEHLKIHSGMKPHRCHICHKDFRQKCVLTRHLRNVHKEEPGDSTSGERKAGDSFNIPQLSDESQSADEKGPFIRSLMLIPKPSAQLRPPEKPTMERDISKPSTSNNMPTQKYSSVLTAKPGISLLTGMKVQTVPVQNQNPPLSSAVFVPIENTNSTAILSPQNYRRLNSSQEKHPCPVCDVECKTRQSFLNHMKRRHRSYKIVSQSEHQFYSSSSSSKPLTIDSFKCFTCDVDFSSKDHLQEHINLVHAPAFSSRNSMSPMSSSGHNQLSTIQISDPLNHYSCVRCDLSFPSKLTLLQHCNEVHPCLGESYLPISISLNKSEALDISSSSADPDQSHGPDTCRKNHINTSMDCETSPMGMSLWTVPQGDNSGYKINEIYKCALCGEGFGTTEVLSYHIHQHLRSYPFFCNFCGYTFKNTTDLENHLDSHRSTQDPLFLSMAGDESDTDSPDNSFAKLGDLHEEDTQKTGLYGCNFCFKSFPRVKNLVLHLKIHITNKPHVCTICGRAFSQVDNLEHHVMMHTGDQSYLCNICGLGFARRTQLISHQKKHINETLHECEQCDMSFRKESDLRLHMLRHQPDCPYFCSVCKEGFSKASELRRHAIVVHEDHDLDKVTAIMPNSEVNPDETTSSLNEMGNESVSRISESNSTLDDKEDTMEIEEGVEQMDGPLDLRRASDDEDDDGILDNSPRNDPDDDLAAMGAYYSNQMTQEKESEPVMTDNNNKTITEAISDTKVHENQRCKLARSAAIKDIWEVEGACDMSDLAGCEDCVKGFKSKSQIKPHLIEEHPAPIELA